MPVPLVAGLDYSTRALDLAVLGDGDQLIGLREFLLGADEASKARVINTALSWARDMGATCVFAERAFLALGGKGKPAFRSSPTLTKLVGKLELVASLVPLKLEFVAVPTWKATILGNGRADKAASLAYAERNYGFRPASDNAADALCIAKFGQGRVLAYW
mgnify:CR=1 FL=1